MLIKMWKICKWVHTLKQFPRVKVTVGEVARWSNMNKATTKRHLEKAIEFGMMQKVDEPYKSTGRAIYSLTKKGLDFVARSDELL